MINFWQKSALIPGFSIFFDVFGKKPDENRQIIL